jgi:hypothetical protein
MCYQRRRETKIAQRLDTYIRLVIVKLEHPQKNHNFRLTHTIFLKKSIPIVLKYLELGLMYIWSSNISHLDADMSTGKRPKPLKYISFKSYYDAQRMLTVPYATSIISSSLLSPSAAFFNSSNSRNPRPTIRAARAGRFLIIRARRGLERYSSARSWSLGGC